MGIFDDICNCIVGILYFYFIFYPLKYGNISYLFVFSSRLIGYKNDFFEFLLEVFWAIIFD